MLEFIRLGFTSNRTFEKENDLVCTPCLCYGLEFFRNGGPGRCPEYIRSDHSVVEPSGFYPE